MASAESGYEAEADVWLDRMVVSLNACSLETFAPVAPVAPGLPTSSSALGDDGATRDSGVLIPLVVGCYQLHLETMDPSIGNDGSALEKSSRSRSGELRLHMIPTRASIGEGVGNKGGAAAIDCSTPTFGDAAYVVKMESGVLDGKWRIRSPADGGDRMALFASACASGRVHLHYLIGDDGTSWRLSPAASSDEAPSSGNGDSPICLSLAWNDFARGGECPDFCSDQIVSSYSDGSVALHSVSCSRLDGVDDKSCRINIEETHRWNAHTIFGCPSEVWTCSFLRGGDHTVLSGADDCSLKMWDIRETCQPTHKIGNSEFEAGVTAVSPHPALDHIFAVGSYDERVRIYDARRLGRPMTKINVCGGVWRIKWHPSCWSSDTRDGCGTMLVAAMHGGCRIVNVPLLGTSSDSVCGEAEILSTFTGHKSMAYGADWVWFDRSGQDVAASCSFYDRQAFMWRVST